MKKPTTALVIYFPIFLYYIFLKKLFDAIFFKTHIWSLFLTPYSMNHMYAILI